VSVFLYAAVVTSLGLVVAYRTGRAVSDVATAGAWLSFCSISLLLTVFLSFGLPVLVALACKIVALSEKQCFNSNDETVWWFALPLVALPAYVVCMFVGRSAGKRDRALAVEGGNQAIAGDPYSAGARAALGLGFALIGLLLLSVAVASAMQALWQKAATFLVLSAGAGFAAFSFRRAKEKLSL